MHDLTKSWQDVSDIQGFSFAASNQVRYEHVGLEDHAQGLQLDNLERL
jgi:hypothetical protein